MSVFLNTSRTSVCEREFVRRADQMKRRTRSQKIQDATESHFKTNLPDQSKVGVRRNRLIGDRISPQQMKDALIRSRNDINSYNELNNKDEEFLRHTPIINICLWFFYGMIKPITFVVSLLCPCRK